MKKNIIKYISIKTIALFFSAGYLISCNKDLPLPVPIVPPQNAGDETIGDAINNDTTYSIFKAAATRVGVLTTLSDNNNSFTVFLPDNTAFRLSGISEDAIAALPITTVAAIVEYHIIPGERLASTNIPTTFPNIQEPSLLSIGTLPGTTLTLQLSNFPSRRDLGFWLNNIPVIAPDIQYTNGIVHKVAAIVNPPGLVLRDALYSNPDLTYLKAAIARADSGQVGLNKLDSLLAYPVTNITVLAPNDAAFKTLLFGDVYSSLLMQGFDPATAAATSTALTSTPAVFSNPALFSVLTAATVQGILVYHFLATPNPLTGAFEPNIRVFSVNFSPTPSYITTLVNSVFPTHPGVVAQATFSGPFVTNLQFTGLGTFPPGGMPYSDAPAKAVSLDNVAVNGIYHVIDKVLLPQ